MWINKKFFSEISDDFDFKNIKTKKELFNVNDKKSNKEKKILKIETKISEEKKNEEKSLILNEMKRIGIEKLPYSYSSLKQFIDSETMNIHYNKHYKGYVKKLNDALSKKSYGDVDLEKIIKNISRYNKTIRNNAGGAFNHALFWNMLSPTPKKLEGELKEKIEKTFGSVNEFKTKFEDAAKKRFGSGWAWLVLTKKGNLKIMSTPNQDNPLMNVIRNGGFPILGLDLWEHSYYLKYKNERDKYIKNFWEVVNWDFVSKMYEMKTNTNLIESIFSKMALNESSSQGCTMEQDKMIQSIFNKNEEVKWIYMKGVNKILKSVFTDNWYEKGEYSEGSMSGVYDLETEGRSILNKMNTNYSAFCILLVDINRVLTALNRPKIKISNVSPQEQIKQTFLFVKLIDEFKTRIFNKESETFRKIIAKLTKTNELGENIEILTVKRMKPVFGKENVKKIGEFGSNKDAIEGVDVEVVDKDGKLMTAQVKSFSRYSEKDGKIIIFDVPNVKKYKTDWICFTNKNKTLVFKNTNIEIINGNYTIDSENLLYELN
jgi:Fe-Mn family superoxide dismutase